MNELTGNEDANVDTRRELSTGFRVDLMAEAMKALQSTLNSARNILATQMSD